MECTIVRNRLKNVYAHQNGSILREAIKKKRRRSPSYDISVLKDAPFFGENL